MCLNFLPNFVQTGRKMADFWEIFHKISNLQMFDPILWRHRGSKLLKILKKLEKIILHPSVTFFSSFCQVSLKSEHVFCKFGNFSGHYHYDVIMTSRTSKSIWCQTVLDTFEYGHSYPKISNEQNENAVCTSFWGLRP